jgi:hypothetical protein
MWKPRRIELETNSSTEEWVMITQLDYPTWKGELIGQGRPATVRPAMPEGLMEVQVPPGSQWILVYIPISFMEHLGRWLSVLSILLCVMFGFKKGAAPDSVEGSVASASPRTVSEAFRDRLCLR